MKPHHTTAAVTAAGVAFAAAGVTIWRLYERVHSVSQAEIEAFVAQLHTDLALTDEADSTSGVVQGWVVRGETPPPGAGDWYWHAAACGGPDPRFAMRAVRWQQGWAASRRDARTQRDQAIRTLINPAVDDAQGAA